jgi:hypothetical protein
MVVGVMPTSVAWSGVALQAPAAAVVVWDEAAAAGAVVALAAPGAPVPRAHAPATRQTPTAMKNGTDFLTSPPCRAKP